MYKCLLWTCYTSVIIVLCVIVYTIVAIIELKVTESKTEEEEKLEEKQISYCVSGAIAGFLIEGFLGYAIMHIRKRINLLENQNNVDVSPASITQETNVISQNENPSESSGNPNNREETPAEESVPAVVSPTLPLAAAYDPNRLDKIVDRIRRAGVDMGIKFPVNDPHVPASF